MTCIPEDKRKKDTIYLEIDVTVGSKPGGGFDKRMSGSTYVNAQGDLNFKGEKLHTIISFTLDNPPAGMRFPADTEACISIEKAGDNDPAKDAKQIFPYVAVSNDGLQLFLVNRNDNKSGKWKYTLYVETGGQVVSMDPMIINRLD